MLKNFALAAANARDWSHAIAQLEEALKICGDCRSRADLHKNLGLIHSRLGDLKNGEHELRIALKLEPKDTGTLKALELIKSVNH